MSQRQARAARRAEAATSPSSGRRAAGHTRLLAAAAAMTVAAVVVVGIVVARGTGPAQAVARTSGSEVSFSGEDPITGNTVDLAAYAGKPVVVNVWGSWCEGCIAEAADLREFVNRHPEMQMIGVDLQDSREGARAFYREWRWEHPSVFDPDGSISFSLGLQGTPTTFFLDADHRVVTQIVGATNLEGFEQGLRTVLSGA